MNALSKTAFVVVVALCLNASTAMHVQAGWRETFKQRTQEAIDWVKGISDRAENLANSIQNSFKRATVGSTQITLGSKDTVSWDHRISWEIDKGFEESDSIMSPFSLELAWYLVEDILPKSLVELHDELSSLKPSSVALLQYGMCVSSYFNKVISLGDLVRWFSRLNYKSSKTAGELSQKGPAVFYDKLPKLVQGALDKLTVPVGEANKANYEAFATSKIASDLWKVAAASRGEKMYSKRLSQARGFIPLIKTRGSDFSESDIEALKYWLQVNVGEFATKVHQEDKSKLKPQLIQFMNDAVAAIGVSTLDSPTKKSLVDFTQGLTKSIKDDSIDTSWAKLEFPSISRSGSISLKTGEYAQYSWNGTQWEADASRLSMYPYANLKNTEVTRMIYAIFNQLDRDGALAMDVFREDPKEGKELYQELKDARAALKKEYIAYDKARKAAAEKALDEDEETEGVVDDTEIKEAQEKLSEAIKAFEFGAAHYAYVRPDSSTSKPESAYDRMYGRFALLQIISGQQRFMYYFKKALGLLMVYGLEVDEALKEIGSVATDYKIDDEGNPLVAKKFVPEEVALAVVPEEDDEDAMKFE